MGIPVLLAQTPILQFFDNQGHPAVGGTVLTQVDGINYPTYQDFAGTIPLPNPIPLNSRGEISTAAGASSQLFLATGVVYTFSLYDAAGNLLNQAVYVTSGTPTNFVTNIASILATIAPFPATLSTQGYTVPGDGGASQYYWDAASDATADGGSVLKPTSIGSGVGCYLLIPTPTLYAAQFGIVADGNGLGVGTDNTTQLLALTAYLGSLEEITLELPLNGGIICYSQQLFFSHTGYLRVKSNGCRWQNISAVPANIGLNIWWGVDYFTNRAPGQAGFVGTTTMPMAIATVAAGARSITFLTPANASQYSLGKRILICGYDQQGFGYPPNLRYFEEVKALTANASTGVVTLDRALKYGYKSTWYSYIDGAGNTIGPAGALSLDRALRYGQQYLEIDHLEYLVNPHDTTPFNTINGDPIYSSESPNIQGYDTVRLGTVKLGQFGVSQCGDIVVQNLTCVDVQGDKLIDQFEIKGGIATQLSDGQGIRHTKCGRNFTVKYNASFTSMNVEYDGAYFANPSGSTGNRPIGTAFFISAESLKIDTTQLLWSDQIGPISGGNYAENGTDPDQPGLYMVTAIALVTGTSFTVAFGDGSSRITLRKGTLLTRPSDKAKFIVDDIVFDGTNFTVSYLSDAAISAADKLWYYPMLSIEILGNNQRIGKYGKVPWISGKVQTQKYTNVSDGFTENRVDTLLRDFLVNGVTTNIYLDAYLEEIEINIEKAYTGAGSNVMQWFTVAPNGGAYGGVINTAVAGRRIITPAAVLNAQAGDTLTAIGYNTYIMAFGLQVLAADNKGNIGYQGYIRFAGGRR